MKDIQILDDPRSEAVARQEAQNAVYAYVARRSASSCTVTEPS